MKLRKALSVLCAVAMLAAALPTASAVEAEPLSEYAGKTIPVLVVDNDHGKTTTRTVEVAIPEGATVEQETALVLLATRGNTSGGFARRSTAEDTISKKYNFNVSFDTVMGAGTLKNDYSTITVTMKIPELSGNSIYVSIKNETTGRIYSDNANMYEFPDYSPYVVFNFYADMMRQGDGVTIYGTASNHAHEGVDLVSCIVTGS